MINRLVFLLLLLLSGHSFAVDRLAVEALASDPAWQRLLHYETSPLGVRESAVISPEFFLASNGRRDAGAELLATVDALTAPVGDDPDVHAQCRFPARWLWLKSQLPERFGRAPVVTCAAYSEWTRANSVDSVSVIYATGYLGNPASYYGHTMLKFNFAGDRGAGSLLDVSVNYGAIVPKDENLVRYIYQGVTGGYDGGFSHIGFYFHNHNYGDNELRDLWEYRLDLAPAEVSLVVAHAWEVLGKRYVYYFFRHNCAYRMAKMLELVGDLDLIPARRAWTIPQAHIQMLVAAQHNGRRLVRETVYHPSRQSRFYARYQALEEQERAALEVLVVQHAEFDTAAYRRLATESRQKVLDAAMDYWQFVGSPWSEASVEIKRQHARVLAQRFREPAGVAVAGVPAAADPASGRLPGYASIGLVTGARHADGWRLRVRPAYYDALDAGNGHVVNATLAMGDVWLVHTDAKTYFERVDLLTIESVAPGISGLPGDQGSTWGMRAGFEQRHRGGDDDLVPKLHGSWGRGWTQGGYLHAALDLTGMLQPHAAGESSGFVGARASLALAPAPDWRLKFAAEHRYPLDAHGEQIMLTRAEVRYALSANEDVRLSYVCEPGALVSREWRISLGHYW